MRSFIAAILLVSGLHAANRLTIDQAIDIREPSDLQFSPDGKRLALTVQEPPAAKPAQRHIWVYDTGSRDLRQWTNSTKSEYSPRWSPDGRTLAFLSDRGEGDQIWLLPASGGEAMELTSARTSVTSFRWSPDGKRIAFLAADPRTAEEERKQKEQDDARVIDAPHPARIWTVDVATKAVRRITGGAWHWRDLAWMPGGTRILASGTDRPADEHRGLERICSVSLEDGAVTEVLTPKGPFQRIQVSPNGSAVAFVSSPGDGPAAQDLFLLPLDTRVPRNLTASRDRPVANFQWLGETELAVLFRDGFRTALETAGGPPRKLVTEDSLQISAFAVSPQGAVAYVAESASVPPELWAGSKPASHFNEALAKADLQRPEFYRYKSFDGTPIEAALFRGAGANPAGPQPLVALIHGGPAGLWSNHFDALTQLLAARGYSVFQPNIRGSMGYGQKFLESNRGDWGGGDFKDVMAGVDDLIARKIADPNRIAIAGWSYGGYMAEWAITQTGRFKAAISGAGMADLATEFGTEARPEGDEWYYGTPYENLAGFLKSSPIVFIKNAKTPTLILQGEADTTDPLSQSQMLYRGLKRYNVPVQFVVYPREPHGLRERKHIADRYQRSLDWIARYLGPAAM
ncbi:MAG: S9 family peptidase [Acidobacteria bacterium]|nr:S9 family peptidase [Acidobacteriota bacterium]